jgi:3-oxoacyl-[acyl-carrier protein] reductase
MTAFVTNQELHGQTALVTGGSGDIGRSIVRSLARRGANILIHYHKNKEKAEKLCNEIKTIGVGCKILQANLMNEYEVKALANQVKALGPIDILINNAGTPIKRIPWLEIDSDFLDIVFAINFRAPLYLIQQLSTIMIERKHGVIINNLSVAAHTCGTDTVFAYGAAKGALLTLTKGLARTLAPYGVRVLAVSPGTIAGSMQDDLTGQDLKAKLLNMIPLGRPGQPEEVGEVIGFLATDYAGFIVGEIIDINGGSLMR